MALQRRPGNADRPSDGARWLDRPLEVQRHRLSPAALDRRYLAWYEVRLFKMAHRLQQLALPSPRTWGGRRAGAGRKPTAGRRRGVPHVARPPHHASYPLHVTLRTGPTIRCLRAARVFPSVRRVLAASSHDGFRVVHFSIQDDHLHLIVEAEDRAALTRGLRGLAVRLARAVNRALGRRGPVCSDRYHARPLTSPRAVRIALVYVLLNRRKHCAGERGLDPCSSAPWFNGWREAVAGPPGPPPVVGARTWLAAVGWRRHGLIDLDAERPKTRAP